MDGEVFLKPKNYEHWFSNNQLMCNTGSLINKFTTKEGLFEMSYDLTDCLKEFFVIVNGIVKNNDHLYQKENRYSLKSLIYHLFQLKNSIYDHIENIIENTEEFLNYEGSDYFEMLSKQGIITNEEAELISCLSNQSFQSIADGIACRNNYVRLNYANDNPEIYFSILENKHTNMDMNPILVLDAPFEIEPGLINLKYWAADELYRVYQMIEICAKIVTGNPEVKPSILANCFEADELISVFEELNGPNM